MHINVHYYVIKIKISVFTLNILLYVHEKPIKVLI